MELDCSRRGKVPSLETGKHRYNTASFCDLATSNQCTHQLPCATVIGNTFYSITFIDQYRDAIVLHGYDMVVNGNMKWLCVIILDRNILPESYTDDPRPTVTSVIQPFRNICHNETIVYTTVKYMK